MIKKDTFAEKKITVCRTKQVFEGIKISGVIKKTDMATQASGTDLGGKGQQVVNRLDFHLH